RACPECRISSSYYIPHKYWISDVGEKEKLIRTFKARTGKIRCKFFVHGHCPFRSDCIYLHELPARRLQRRRWQWRRMPAVSGVPLPGAGLGTCRLWLILPSLPQEFISSSSESSDEEDE
ncbi:MKRN1 ligase, partial [Horornis vulcanius]|nr:MKRN1 ligase [Horornis vulcanius]